MIRVVEPGEKFKRVAFNREGKIIAVGETLAEVFTKAESLPGGTNDLFFSTMRYFPERETLEEAIAKEEARHAEHERRQRELDAKPFPAHTCPSCGHRIECIAGEDE